MISVDLECSFIFVKNIGVEFGKDSCECVVTVLANGCWEPSVSLWNTLAVLSSGGHSLGSGSKIFLSEDIVWLLGSTAYIGLFCSSMYPVSTCELVM